MDNENTLTVLHTHSVIELFYTLYPFLLSNIQEKRVKFIYFKPEKLDTISGKNVLFLRIFKGRFDDTKFVNSTLKQLKNSFENVFFLDDSAGADSTHFEFIDSIDGYYKAKLLSNKKTYNKTIYGRHVFSDYYHHHFKITDDEMESYRNPVDSFQETEKLKTAFNVGYGWYPNPSKSNFLKYFVKLLARTNNFQLIRPLFLNQHRKLIDTLDDPINFHSKQLKVSARFRYQSYPNSIGYQRFLFEKIIKNHQSFLTGIVSPKKYLDEQKQTFATLSPFGYGEVCIRDFECIINGSLLIKPDMSHVVTQPNIYIPNETYIPVKWDGSDLLDVVDNVLSNTKYYQSVAENARTIYRKSLINIESEFMSVFGALLN
ncbi:hypothetical protein [Rhodohalobacter sulfatireducens]|uniref:Glycosyltransferase family 1 protein n=1 Tax=Rhodohalobacter sulfatireducens TaxID=2911366 RepID=A0ABS9KIZ2_9BACT|nr:hypothetical protein [Rhodohalobacter sulfatireducens]MCG2590816.1 hypothetical protein [Rhodohalobacter sulfatireducens]